MFIPHLFRLAFLWWQGVTAIILIENRLRTGRMKCCQGCGLQSLPFGWAGWEGATQLLCEDTRPSKQSVGTRHCTRQSQGQPDQTWATRGEIFWVLYWGTTRAGWGEKPRERCRNKERWQDLQTVHLCDRSRVSIRSELWLKEVSRQWDYFILLVVWLVLWSEKQIFVLFS